MSDLSEAIHDNRALFSGLVAGYDFRGDAKDFSGNGNDGTVTGATLTTDQFGIADSAYELDGVDDSINVGTLGTFGSSISTGATVSLRVKFPTTPSDYDNIFGVVNTGMDYAIRYIGGEIGVYVRGSNNLKNEVITSGENITTDTWYDIVVVTSGTSASDIKVYIDGSEATVTENYDQGITASDFVSDIYLGARGPGSNFMNVVIESCLVFNTVKSADEIKAITDLLSSGYVYPYPKHVSGGITE